jgi:hypothetical protein
VRAEWQESDQIKRYHATDRPVNRHDAALAARTTPAPPRGAADERSELQFMM